MTLEYRPRRKIKSQKTGVEFMSDLTIGQLAKSVSVKTDTVRHYEKLGLIAPESRSDSGYRLYNAKSVLRLKFILKAKEVGFTLNETKSLLQVQASDTATCKDMLVRTNKKLQETSEKLVHLKRIKAALGKLAKECPGGDAPLEECPILDFLEQHLED